MTYLRTGDTDHTTITTLLKAVLVVAFTTAIAGAEREAEHASRGGRHTLHVDLASRRTGVIVANLDGNILRCRIRINFYTDFRLNSPCI